MLISDWSSDVCSSDLVRKYRFATLAISWTYRQKWCPIPRIKRRRGGIAVDIRQLRYFVQIVESGSLSKDSRQLYVAQPALSQQLAKLEDKVGQPMLHRSSKGVSPTENGPAPDPHPRFTHT